jgi:hypothetical protein
VSPDVLRELCWDENMNNHLIPAVPPRNIKVRYFFLDLGGGGGGGLRDEGRERAEGLWELCWDES